MRIGRPDMECTLTMHIDDEGREMQDSAQKARLLEMVNHLAAIVRLADEDNNHLVAAQCEDIRLAILSQLDKTE